MSLKTATLIALIGVALRFVLTFVNPVLLGRYEMIYKTIIFYGSLILFFAVFYSKQKEQE